MKSHVLFFENQFHNNYKYLMRHFHKSLRRRLALLILGKKQAYNLLYDAAGVGYQISRNIEGQSNEQI